MDNKKKKKNTIGKILEFCFYPYQYMSKIFKDCNKILKFVTMKRNIKTVKYAF